MTAANAAADAAATAAATGASAANEHANDDPAATAIATPATTVVADAAAAVDAAADASATPAAASAGSIQAAELLFRRGNLLLLAGTLPLALRDFNAIIKVEALAEFTPPVFSADAMKMSWQRIKASLPPPAPRSVLALLSAQSYHPAAEQNTDLGSGGGDSELPGITPSTGIKLSATAAALQAQAVSQAVGASLGLTSGAGVASAAAPAADEAVIPRDVHNPALDLAFSLAVFEPLAFAREGLAIMEAYYTELLIQHGPSARVYWYRANIYKLQHALVEYVADLERMHLCDDKFLRRYLATYDARYDYCDENACTWVQWTLVLQVRWFEKICLKTEADSRESNTL